MSQRFFDRDGNERRPPDEINVTKHMVHSQFEQLGSDAVDVIKKLLIGEITPTFEFYHGREPLPDECNLTWETRGDVPPKTLEFRLTVRKRHETINQSSWSVQDPASRIIVTDELREEFERLGFKIKTVAEKIGKDIGKIASSFNPYFPAEFQWPGPDDKRLTQIIPDDKKEVTDDGDN